jgi:17beta-estradiol 17-dehydrogenase / very-long-chain 3-oxoacyl-CoA reductase
MVNQGINQVSVVTGSTDGIGREFALQLAKAGFGIVLVSRSQAKLDELAKTICWYQFFGLGYFTDVATASQYDVPTKVQAMDFSEADLTAGYQALAQKIADVDVGVLGGYPLSSSLVLKLTSHSEQCGALA